MKVIIAGSRTIQESEFITDAIEKSGLREKITEVVCGGAKGVDMLGKEWAVERGIRVTYFWANWDAHGRRAGVIRNREMAEYADALIAIWDGQSRGTKNMIEVARELGLKVFVGRIPQRKAIQ